MLVSVGENTRLVSYSTPVPSQSAAVSDVDTLKQAVQIKFKDILNPRQEFFLQIKSEEWGGAFLDLLGSEKIADKSVVRAVIKPMTEVN